MGNHLLSSCGKLTYYFLRQGLVNILRRHHHHKTGVGCHSFEVLVPTSRSHGPFLTLAFNQDFLSACTLASCWRERKEREFFFVILNRMNSVFNCTMLLCLQVKSHDNATCVTSTKKSFVLSFCSYQNSSSAGPGKHLTAYSTQIVAVLVE